jgi:hypothetical protein
MILVVFFIFFPRLISIISLDHGISFGGLRIHDIKYIITFIDACIVVMTVIR